MKNNNIQELELCSSAAEREILKLPKTIQDILDQRYYVIRRGRIPTFKIKPLNKTVGKGAFEIIINGRPAFRSIYTKHKGKVIILHSFKKTTNGIDLPAMKLAKKRYKQYLADNK